MRFTGCSSRAGAGLRPALVVGLALLAAGAPLRAQAPDARALIAQGLALAEAGDTAAALDRLRQAVEAEPRMAEAQFQLGRLLARHASGRETDFRERLAAEKALLRAIELDPDNAEYMAELGRLRIKQHRQVEGARLLDRALAKTERSAKPADRVRADIEFGLGYRKELEYERLRDRRLVPPTLGPISSSVPPNREAFGLSVGEEGATIRLSRYVESYLQMAPPLERSGADTREAAIRHYRKALSYDPTHYDAGRRLLVLLYDERAMEEYLGLARRLAAAHPDRPELLLYVGLGLHALGQEDEAEAAFEEALSRMPEKERAPCCAGNRRRLTARSTIRPGPSSSDPTGG